MGHKLRPDRGWALPRARAGAFLAFVALFSVACAVAPPGAPPALESPAAATPAVRPAPVLLSPEPPPGRAAQEFKTDFSRHTVPYSDILSGGPPKDGIPAIDAPQFVTVAAADAWLRPKEPVILVEAGGVARAYPLQVLMWHEIVNDTVGGVPLAITFCPLCNTAIVFDRTVDGRVLDFGTTGRLRFSNLIMYDRQTESWWQQAEGDAIAGEYAGRRLAYYPAALVAWDDFRAAHPDGEVMSRETGFTRDYGRNPYGGYDDIRQTPFLYQGPETGSQLPPMARVLTVEVNGDAVAYPYDILAEARLVHDVVGGRPVVVFWADGVASALDATAIAEGRDVGSAAAFSPLVDGRPLTFGLDGDRIVDAETGSEWNLLGRAVAGELTGRQLEAVIGINHFWFSWAAFRPDTRVYGR